MPRRHWAQYSEQEVLEAIRGSFGIMSHVADRLQCSWITARRYTDHWAVTRDAMMQENERALDLSESKLLEKINEGDGPMIRFHLATKGKSRGYVERQETVSREEVAEVVTKVVRRAPGA